MDVGGRVVSGTGALVAKTGGVLVASPVAVGMTIPACEPSGMAVPVGITMVVGVASAAQVVAVASMTNKIGEGEFVAFITKAGSGGVLGEYKILQILEFIEV